MKKQMFHKIKNTIAILLMVLFVLSAVGVATSALAGTSSLSSSSQTMFSSPYKYNLYGNGISIIYTPKVAGVKTVLTYKDKKFGTLFFSNNKIHTVNVQGLGTILSVTLGTQKIAPGAAPHPQFSILIPEVNLQNRSGVYVPIHTMGTTTYYKSASLPPSSHIGQVESYVFTQLNGTAYGKAYVPINPIIPIPIPKPVLL